MYLFIICFVYTDCSCVRTPNWDTGDKQQVCFCLTSNFFFLLQTPQQLDKNQFVCRAHFTPAKITTELVCVWTPIGIITGIDYFSLSEGNFFLSGPNQIRVFWLTCVSENRIGPLFGLFVSMWMLLVKLYSRGPTHQRPSWAPPGGGWRGFPWAAPWASWPLRSGDSPRCSGRWWPRCGRRRTPSSGGQWCCLPWSSGKTRRQSEDNIIARCRSQWQTHEDCTSVWIHRRRISRRLLVTLMKAYPAPLSVMVRPSASSVLVTSTSLVSPRTWAKMKSSRPICPPRSFCMSTLCELRVQNKICREKKWS